MRIWPLRRDPRQHYMFLQNLLQYCARNSLFMEGRACHGQLIRMGLPHDTLTSNILVNFYCKCVLLGSARKKFDEMPERNLVSWNTIIGAYAQMGHYGQALSLFLLMQREQTQFSEFTVSSVLCACAAKRALVECKQLHAFAVKAAMDSNVFVGTALLDVYSKCGFIKEASRVFDSIEEKGAVTWSSMVSGYVRNELYDEALRLYHRAHVLGIEQNKFSISSVLAVCAEIAALIEGNQVHAVSCKVGFVDDIFVSASLINMYAKCGTIAEAYSLFSDQENKNIVSWNAMISGFSRHGRCLESMVMFEKMQQVGMSPDEVTYLSVLSACGHKGLVEKGRKYFDLIKKQHNLSPNLLHYSCLVDILSRSGLIQEAYDTIQTMPFEPTVSIWGSLLSSCRNFGNVELAEVAAKRLFEIEPMNAGNHVLLADTYAKNKKWDQVSKSRTLIKDSRAFKTSGQSWIQIKNKIHTFMVGERNHPQITVIYAKLDELMREMEKLGYKAETEHEVHNVEESKKEELLRQHSEKLALAFGIMNLPPVAPVRIMKNLRICKDCHRCMKLASKITEREIIVRDVNRFHHFRNGFCSCGDFW